MGEFASFRRPLLIALPIGYVLALFLVESVRRGTRFWDSLFACGRTAF